MLILFLHITIEHINFTKACLFLWQKKRRSYYLLLAKVKAHFIYTYTDYLEDACIIIEKAIRAEKAKRQKSPSKTYKPNPFVIIDSINQRIKENIAQQNAKLDNYNEREVKKFVNKLISDYSIPKLYEDDEAFGEFREKYTTNSEEITKDILNKFLKSFMKFRIIYIEEYKQHKKWYQKIKSSKEKVFKNKQDEEDIKLASEFLSYNEEFGLLSFFTCDFDCYKSIIKIAKEYDLPIGQVHWIK